MTRRCDACVGARGMCASCKALAKEDSRRRWDEKNPGKQAEYVRAAHQRAAARWAISGRPPRSRKWESENPEQVTAIKRKYVAANRDVLNEKQKTQRSKTKDHQAQLQKNRIARNYQHFRSAWANRRARKRNASGHHTAEDIQRLYERQLGICNGCRRSLDKFDIDHVMPLALGGSNQPGNLQLLCPPCNRSKGALHPDEWRERVARKSQPLPTLG